jgi:hypothetical protein
MSVSVFFSFSTGFSKPLHCPKGTLGSIMRHVAAVESTLGLKVVPPGEGNIRTYGPACGGHWDSFKRDWSTIPDETLCETVERHNAWVRDLYSRTTGWSKAAPTEDTETITPEQGATFWHALEILTVPPDRWTEAYYRSRMESVYAVLRGHKYEGYSLDAKALTPKQAGAVIRIFEEFLDPGDQRLEVPDGQDYLASSDNGEYEWCSTHGAIAQQDLPSHSRKRCELGKELREEYRES